MEAFTSVSTAYRPSRIEALLILTLVATAALTLVGGWDQAVDPFLRNDDYPAFFARADMFFATTLSEGRWVMYLWHLRAIETPAWLNLILFNLGSATFAAALALQALGRDRLWLASLTAALVAISPQATLLAGWFNTLIPCIWTAAVYAVVTLYLSPRTSRFLLFLFVPLGLLGYSTYTLLMLLVCLVRRDAAHSLADYLALMATFVAAFALGMLVMYGINWQVHGVFGLSYANWRGANEVENLAGLAANISVLIDSYRWVFSGLGFGHIWLSTLNAVAFLAAILVVARRRPIEALYLFTGLAAGAALLSALALKDGVFIFFRSTQFVWAAYAVTLARAYVALQDENSPRALTVALGLAGVTAASAVFAFQTFVTLAPFNALTRDIAGRIPEAAKSIRIVGRHDGMPEAQLARILDVSALQYRFHALTGLPTISCHRTPDQCADRVVPRTQTTRIEVEGDVARIVLPEGAPQLAKR